MTPAAKDRQIPFLVLPWQGGATGWVVVFGAIIVLIIAGLVTNTSPMAVAAPILIAPAAVAVGLGVAQWYQVRSFGAERSSWVHFGGIAIALLAWTFWPISPPGLQGTGNASDACSLIYTDTPSCLARAASAFTGSTVTWWVTGALILALAPLVRQSKIAAWASIPVAFAGCLLATHFLELLLVHYHAANVSVGRAAPSSHSLTSS
jgi:hypothetical protein